jgi:hypothetical protein
MLKDGRERVSKCRQQRADDSNEHFAKVLPGEEQAGAGYHCRW